MTRIEVTRIEVTRIEDMASVAILECREAILEWREAIADTVSPSPRRIEAMKTTSRLRRIAAYVDSVLLS